MKHLNFTLVLVLSLLLTACGGKKQKDQSSDSFSIQDYIKTAETIDPNLNSVDQLLAILDMVNAEYYDMLTNDPYNAHSYKTSYPVAAANMGIYVTDILYHYYGEATETMYLTFQAAQELAKYLGVESRFGTWTIEKLEGTNMKRDTIVMLFNDLMKDSQKYSSEKEMLFVHTAFLTGSFIEKVYISGNLLKQKMMIEERSEEDEGDIRELLVIYLNQLNLSTGALYDALLKQQDQLEGVVVLNSFKKLKELSERLADEKASLAVAPVNEIAANEDLVKSFDVVADLRSFLITSSE